MLSKEALEFLAEQARDARGVEVVHETTRSRVVVVGDSGPLHYSKSPTLPPLITHEGAWSMDDVITALASMPTEYREACDITVSVLCVHLEPAVSAIPPDAEERWTFQRRRFKFAATEALEIVQAAGSEPRASFVPNVLLRWLQLGMITHDRMQRLSNLSAKKDTTDTVALRTEVVARDLPDGPYQPVQVAPFEQDRSATNEVMLRLDSGDSSMLWRPASRATIPHLVACGARRFAASLERAIEHAGHRVHSITCS